MNAPAVYENLTFPSHLKTKEFRLESGFEQFIMWIELTIGGIIIIGE